MTNKELQEKLKQYPDDWDIKIKETGKCIHLDPQISTNCIYRGFPSEGKASTIVFEIKKDKEESCESFANYTLNDLAGKPFCFIGHFHNWDEFDKFSKDFKPTEGIGYIFHKTDSNQYFGFSKEKKWIDITYSVTPPLIQEFNSSIKPHYETLI